ncbi:13984_t:CDS:1, partial [Gigaspora rosea]
SYVNLYIRRGDIALSILAGSLAFYFSGPNVDDPRMKTSEKSLWNLAKRRFKKIAEI